MTKKVLIVDDSTFMRMVLRDIVKNNQSDVEIFEADGEKQALALLKRELPDLVFLDIIMNNSEVEGIDVLEVIHSDYPQIPTIMITSVGYTSIQEKCKSLGAKGYIKKPFDIGEIKEQLIKFL